MDVNKKTDLLRKLLACISSEDMRQILSELGDSPDATIDRPFGPHGLVWKAFGGTASNVSSVGLGSKPGRSLTERITNAVDAILELRARSDIQPPDSPQTAAQRWFGRPISAPDSGLFSWKNQPAGFDQQIAVVVHQSGKPSCPTIDVVDTGIGIEPQHFPDTILSLQRGNKIRKRYLIGAFGQGGAATLGFCDYAIIVSRADSAQAPVAFTIIRVLRLDASYKEDCYAYLTLSVEDQKVEILAAEGWKGPIDILPKRGVANIPASIDHGTLVRHVSYRLTNLDKNLHASPGNLYHYLHFSMFDPLIPFRLVDLRPNAPKNEYVGGARNRLMSRVRKAAAIGDEDDEARAQLRHYRPLEYIVPQGTTDPCIGIEYWVILSFKKKGEDGLELRSHSNELFVQQGYPIVGTVNGQNQGEHSALLLKKINLALVARHIVIHVDATASDSTIRRELFATSREGFKDGPALESIFQLLTKILEEDETLAEIEKELTDRITKRDTESTKNEVKLEVVKLLKEAGLTVTEIGTVSTPGGGEKKPVERPRGRAYRVREPLPTLAYPQVTRFEIVYPRDIFSVPVNDSQLVVIETDADAAFDKRIAIRSEPPLLEIATHAPLSGGRIRWRLRPIKSAVPSQEGEVVATLTRLDGTQLESRLLFQILPAREKESKKAAGQVPPFDIKPVSPEDSELWNHLWPEDGGDERLQRAHGYRVLEAEGKHTVYYSDVFAPFKTELERLRSQHPKRVAPFIANYEIWIGYHAILQAHQPKHEEDGIADEVVEQLQEQERQTVAKVQVRQALRLAEFAEKLTMRDAEAATS